MRRSLLLLSLAVCLASAVAACGGAGGDHGGVLAGVERPNLVVIVTDDQRWDTLFAMPQVEAGLVARGVTFDNAFASNPVCCPFRAGFLSGGYYSHHTGVLTAVPPNGTVARFDDRETLGTLLQRRGYRTALVGKYMNRYGRDEPRVPPGWDRFVGTVEHRDWWAARFVAGSSGPDEPTVGERLTADAYLTDFQAAEALAFLDGAAAAGGEQPFFLYLAFDAPHRPAQAPPADRRRWADYAYRARGWGESDLGDKPGWVRRRARAAAERGGWGPGLDDLPGRQLATLAAIDRAVGRLLERLDELGVAERTLVAFTSDNGMLWGEHGLMTKAMPYEESIRVPLVVRAPGVEPGRSPALVAADLDLAATVAELAGLQPRGDGASLVPLLADPAVAGRRRLLLEGFGVDPGMVPPWTAVRTAGWKYVEYVSGERELYDLETDPYELASLHADPARAGLIDELAAELDGFRGLAMVTARELPPATAGRAYSLHLEARGGTPPYRWRLAGGRLPPGLVLDAAGELTGTPEHPGGGAPMIEVSDSSTSPFHGRPQSFLRRLRLTVQPASRARPQAGGA